MNIYFLTFDILPSRSSSHLANINGGAAHCWVKSDSEKSALLISRFKVQQYGWDIVSVSQPPIPVSEDHFEDRDIGLARFRDAVLTGISLVFNCHTNDEERLARGSEELPFLSDFNIEWNLKVIHESRQTGRCLHYQGGEHCEEIIDAHTIQKSASLKPISKSGMVYTITNNLNEFKRSGGILSFQKKGIKTVSTFRGFCRKHDNELFEPIDDSPLIPTDEQIFLYAYRNLCRELFAKECVLRSQRTILDNSDFDPATVETLEAYLEGSEIGRRSLQRQKDLFDQALVSDSYSDVRYVVFHSETTPNVVFSGGLFPDFGFNSEPIQNLAAKGANLDFIAFFSAPMENGWGFAFAWHKDSTRSAKFFLHTLAKKRNKGTAIEDSLFTLVIKGSENTAISPDWWDNLSELDRNVVKEGATHGANLFAYPSASYLEDTLLVPHNWKFGSVSDKSSDSNEGGS